MQNQENRETLIDQLKDKKSSQFSKYSEMVTGKKSIPFLIKYELIMLIASTLPGAFGYWLRKKLYRKMLGRTGKNCLFGANMVLRYPSNIELGDDFFADDFTVLDAKGPKSLIRTGSDIYLGRNTKFSCSNSKIILGDDVSIGPDCFVRAGLGDIRIGSQITIGAQTIIISGNPSQANNGIPMKKQVGSGKGITIGNDVWIGVGVRIVDGVRIGNGVVIGAGSVVLRDIPDESIAAGVPARIIGSRKKQKA